MAGHRLSLVVVLGVLFSTQLAGGQVIVGFDQMGGIGGGGPTARQFEVREQFLKRVQGYDFDMAVASLGTHKEDQSAPALIRALGSNENPASRFHQVIIDFRVAKLRSLIAALPEGERARAAEEIFDRKMDAYVETIDRIARWHQMQQPNPHPGSPADAHYAVCASLLLCADFSTPTAVVEKLDYAESKFATCMQVFRADPATSRFEVPGFEEHFDRLFSANLAVLMLDRREVPHADIQKALGGGTNVLQAVTIVRWDAARNSVVLVNQRTPARPGYYFPGIGRALPQFHPVLQGNDSAKALVLVRLKELLNKDDVRDQQPLPQ